MEALSVALLCGFAWMAIASMRRLLSALAGGPEWDRSTVADPDIARAAELTDRKLVLLRSIQATQMDRSAGKISDEESAGIVDRLERETAGVLREIDSLRGADSDVAAADRDLDEVAAAGSARRAATHWSAAALARHGGVSRDAATPEET